MLVNIVYKISPSESIAAKRIMRSINCSAAKIISTVSNKGIYGLHNITTIHMETGVKLDI